VSVAESIPVIHGRLSGMKSADLVFSDYLRLWKEVSEAPGWSDASKAAGGVRGEPGDT